MVHTLICNDMLPGHFASLNGFSEAPGKLCSSEKMTLSVDLG